MRASTHIGRRKKPGDPNSTMSSVCNTPLTFPPGAPPLPPLIANTYAANNAVLATSNPSGWLSGTHRFIVIASSLLFVVDAMCIGSHLNSNKNFFFLVLTTQTHRILC
jgi:hypothetical protein